MKTAVHFFLAVSLAPASAFAAGPVVPATVTSGAIAPPAKPASATTASTGGTAAIGDTTTPTGTVGTNGGSVYGTYIAPQAPVPQAPSSASINPAANVGQASQNGGAGANAAIGAALIAAAMPMLSQPPTVPTGMALMAMGMLALAQSGADSGAAGQSGNTAAASVSTPNPTSTASSPGTMNDGGMAAAFNTPQGQKAVAAIQAAGGNMSPNGVTMPDGSFQPWSSFQSAGAMNAAGLPGSDAMAQLGNIEKKMGVGSSGSAGGGALAEGVSPGASTRSLPEFKLQPFKNPFNLSASERAKLVEGKTKTYGGDLIGVPMDNLFAMIHRAYEKKRNNDEFILSPASAVAGSNRGSVGRSPASFGP